MSIELLNKYDTLNKYFINDISKIILSYETEMYNKCNYFLNDKNRGCKNITDNNTEEYCFYHKCVKRNGKIRYKNKICVFNLNGKCNSQTLNDYERYCYKHLMY